MNFTNIGVLGLVIFAITDFLKPLIPKSWPSNATQVLAAGVAIGSVFLVGATTWATTVQFDAKHNLSDMRGWDKVVAGILCMGVATGIDRLSLFSSRSRSSGMTPPPADVEAAA